jgi:2-polyprenyl-6-methoxyphenol hydroxylase-like FAD-dependent oxidoreductase
MSSSISSPAEHRKRLHVGIAGAGPAGLSAALFLARDGHRVTILDQFDTPRPLGSGLILQPTGLAVLAELRLFENFCALGAPIERLFGRTAPSGRIVLDVRYDALGPGRTAIAVHRATLFGLLHRRVEAAGIELLGGRRIIAIDRAGGGRPILLAEGGRREGPFDIVIDALGVRSPLWSQLGGRERRELPYGALWASLPAVPPWAGSKALEQRYRRASEMVGVLPIGRRPGAGEDEVAFFWSIRTADHAAWHAAGLTAWKDRVADLWPAVAPLLDLIERPEQMVLARYCHHAAKNPVGERIAAIGDAAHAASPQLGQGANMALLDAAALALALRTPGDPQEALALYARLRRWHVRFYQALSAVFTPFYQSDSRILPIVRDFLLAPGTRLPLVRRFVAASVAGAVLDPLGRIGEDP